MTYQDIEYELAGSAAIIRLNRPETLNAFTHKTLEEIRHAVDTAAANPQVVGIVITGNGRGFSSGLDSSVLASVTSGETQPHSAGPKEDELPGIFSYLLRVPKPVIAAINGVAAGGGLILALMSDIRIASTTAAFTTVFLKRGLIAEHGSSWILPRLVGIGRALDLLWMSDKISAQEALQLGLIEKLAEPENLVADAVAYVERLAVTSAPAAIAETKKLVYAHLGTSYEEALKQADDSTNRFVVRDDAREGAMALLEKRAPNFERLGKKNNE